MTKSYTVGYGKPPKKSQFKPGNRANPKGRGKGVNNLATDLREEMSEKITVRENGITTKVTKQRALIKRVMARGLDNDMRAASGLMTLAAKLLESELSQEATPTLDTREAEILEALVQRRIQAAMAERATSVPSKPKSRRSKKQL